MVENNHPGAIMTRLSGYISDQSCPSHPEHGEVFGMATGGYYCSHHTHDFPTISQSWWTEDQWQEAKSLTIPDDHPTYIAPRKIAIRKSKR